MALSTYQSTRLQRNELMRQNIEQNSTQGSSAHPRPDRKIEEKNIQKNSVISSYDNGLFFCISRYFS